MENGLNWFSEWEEQLPSPEELVPLSQALITPVLALAFDIGENINTPITSNNSNQTPPPLSFLSHNNSSSVANSTQPHSKTSLELKKSGKLGYGATGEDELATSTLKRPRVVWTPQLHERFADVVLHLGVKKAVPKSIMHLMNVDGLTRENVASHLQKFRVYLKKEEEKSVAGGGLFSDTASDQLFASSAHHLNRGTHNSDNFSLFAPVATLLPHYHRQNDHHQQQYDQPRQVGHYRSSLYRQFEQSYLTRQPQQPVHMIAAAPGNNSPSAVYMDDFVSIRAIGDKKSLTLFPSRDD